MSTPIHELLDLPETMPRCVVEINTFDDPGRLRENVADYVITPTVAEELEKLVARIVASARRAEPGEGHYVHGAFGSGKSHFMGILGLILSNNDVIWEKDHELIRKLEDKYREKLKERPILTTPPRRPKSPSPSYRRELDLESTELLQRY